MKPFLLHYKNPTHSLIPFIRSPQPQNPLFLLSSFFLLRSQIKPKFPTFQPSHQIDHHHHRTHHYSFLFIPIYIQRERGEMDSDQGKLFIGGISWDTTEDKLKEHFGNYGDVLSTSVMREKNTGKPRGFGFVVFADPTILDRVLEDKHVIDGRTVTLYPVYTSFLLLLMLVFNKFFGRVC